METLMNVNVAEGANGEACDGTDHINGICFEFKSKFYVFVDEAKDMYNANYNGDRYWYDTLATRQPNKFYVPVMSVVITQHNTID